MCEMCFMIAGVAIVLAVIAFAAGKMFGKSKPDSE